MVTVCIAIIVVRKLVYQHSYTVNGETFAGLNFHGFHPMKFFTGKILRCLAFKTLSLYIFMENFHGTLENSEGLAQRIFPHLR